MIRSLFLPLVLITSTAASSVVSGSDVSTIAKVSLEKGIVVLVGDPDEPGHIEDASRRPHLNQRAALDP